VQQNVVRDGWPALRLAERPQETECLDRHGLTAPKGSRDRPAQPRRGLSINEMFDQSKLVTASIAAVLREGAIRGRGLTG